MSVYLRFYTLQFNANASLLNIGGLSLFPPSKGEHFRAPPFPKASLPWPESEWVAPEDSRGPLEGAPHTAQPGWLSSGRSCEWLERRTFLTIIDPFEPDRILGTPSYCCCCCYYYYYCCCCCCCCYFLGWLFAAVSVSPCVAAQATAATAAAQATAATAADVYCCFLCFRMPAAHGRHNGIGVVAGISHNLRR